jgi:hypothetical protein
LGIALIGLVVIFRLATLAKALPGKFKVGMIGLMFGLPCFTDGRNLWPLILVHGRNDSRDMISHFFGG